MSPKPDVSAERKQQIHEAALACFARSGYHLTTMDDIVVESGLSKGTLYWYFDSKKALFLSLFEEMMADFGQTWETIVSSEARSPKEKLQESIAYFRTLKDLLPFFGIVMEAYVLTRHDEDVETLVREYYQPYLAMMAQIIEDGNTSGEFSVESPEATALVVLTLFDGVMLALGTGLGTFDWDKMMDAAEKLVLNGVGAKL